MRLILNEKFILLDNYLRRKKGLCDLVEAVDIIQTIDPDVKNDELHFQTGDVKNDFGLISPDPDELNEDCFEEDMSDDKLPNSTEGEIEKHSSKTTSTKKELGLQEQKKIVWVLGYRLKKTPLNIEECERRKEALL